MSTDAELGIVLRALEAACKDSSRRWTTPGAVAQRTPEFMGRTATGRRQPMGERRVRRLLAELADSGEAQRTRNYWNGLLYRTVEA